MNQMNGKRKETQYYKRGITPEKILAYIESKAGASQSATAQVLGVGRSTVSRWTGEIEDYIKSSPQYQEAAPIIAQMIPRALKVYGNRLEFDDLSAARDVLKMAVIFVERKQVESSDNSHRDSDLWNELGGLFDNAGSISLPESESDDSGENQGDSDNTGTETPAD